MVDRQNERGATDRPGATGATDGQQETSPNYEHRPVGQAVDGKGDGWGGRRARRDQGNRRTIETKQTLSNSAREEAARERRNVRSRAETET